MNAIYKDLESRVPLCILDNVIACIFVSDDYSIAGLLLICP
jgi:hypothetical protein